MTDDLTLIPGDALADLLTGGWIGPAEFLQYRTWYAGALLRPTCGYISRPGHGDDIASYSPENIRLNLLRPESLDHVARVLAQGLRCPMRVGAECGENIAAGEWIAYGSPSHPLRVVPPVCPRCAGSGWLRKPAPIYHLTDAARTSALSPLVIAQAAGWSVRNVARGGEALRGVYGPVEVHSPALPEYRRRRLLCGSGEPEMCPHESEADARWCAALAAGFALLTPDGATFPEIR